MPSVIPDQSSPATSGLTSAMRNHSLAPSSAQKRRNVSPSAGSSSRRRTNENEPDHGSESDRLEDPSQVYDPDQPIEQRRKIQQGLRELSRKLADDPDEYLKASSTGLRSVLQSSNRINKEIRQTTEAAIDSRLLVTVADLSYRKTMRLMQGSSANGLDIDDFLTKAIHYMRHGGGINDSDDDNAALTATQRHRRTAAAARQALDSDDNDDGSGADGGADEESGDMLNWEHLGRYAAIPCNSRPPSMGFLLGPLHAEKKMRRIGKRIAPLRPNMLPETRPEVLDTNALSKVDNDLTVICAKILNQLSTAQEEIQDTLESLAEGNTDEENVRLMHQYGLRSTGGIDLLRFVVNPQSYAQTVENMFYVSFLIRDGKVSVEFDEDGMPSLLPFLAEDQEPGSRSADARHQAIFTLDKHTWRDIVQTLEITEPMIPHRETQAPAAPGAHGWYS